MLGANGIVGAGLPITAGAGVAAQLEGQRRRRGRLLRRRRDRRGAVPRVAEHRLALEAAGDLGLREQPVRRRDTGRARRWRPPNVADLAAGYSMPGYVVDGNDVLAVYTATREAVRRARAGEGPTLLECKTWRTPSARPARRRQPGSPAAGADRRTGPRATRWRAFERYLLERGIMTADQLADVGQTDRPGPGGRGRVRRGQPVPGAGRGAGRRVRAVARLPPPRADASPHPQLRGGREPGRDRCQFELRRRARNGDGRGDAARPARLHDVDGALTGPAAGVRAEPGAPDADLRGDDDRDRGRLGRAAASARSSTGAR